MGQNWVTKRCFSKNDPRPFRMLKQVLLAHFEPMVACFAPWKIPKCLEHGKLWDQKWPKKGSKMDKERVVPRVILDHSGCSNKWF